MKALAAQLALTSAFGFALASSVSANASEWERIDLTGT